MNQQVSPSIGPPRTRRFSSPAPASATRRVLVVANETIAGAVLHDVIVGQHGAEVVVVAPALNSRIRHWTSDEDRARSEAAARLEDCVAALRDAGVDARGHVGDADPMQAIADALVFFDADELLVATHPEQRSNWLAHDLVGRACARFGLPVAHLVVDDAAALPALALAA